MDIWLNIILPAIITLVLSGILIPIFTGVIGRKITKYFDDKEENEKKERERKEAAAALAKENAEKLAKIEKAQQEELLLEKVDSIVKKHTDPIDTQLEQVEADLSRVKCGTVDTLRDRILSCYYKCEAKGYYTQYEFENIHHMYDDYVELKGNSFVERCLKDFDSLDSEEKWKAKQKRKATTRTKKILNEKK